MQIGVFIFESIIQDLFMQKPHVTNRCVIITYFILKPNSYKQNAFHYIFHMQIPRIRNNLEGTMSGMNTQRRRLHTNAVLVHLWNARLLTERMSVVVERVPQEKKKRKKKMVKRI